MRVLICGGTYNPVHIGHLYMADEARIRLGYDRVLFVPSNIPAHKRSATIIEPVHRIAMLEIALQPFDDYAVDRCEIDRGGVSYTIDSVREIRRRMRLDGNPGLLIGDDLLEGFNRWMDVETLVNEVDLVVARRLRQPPSSFPYQHTRLDNLLLPISSSDIRERIREGRAFRHLVPAGVDAYISDQRLYDRPAG